MLCADVIIIGETEIDKGFEDWLSINKAIGEQDKCIVYVWAKKVVDWEAETYCIERWQNYNIREKKRNEYVVD